MTHVTGPIMRGRAFAITPYIMAEFFSAVPGIAAHFTTATFAAVANIGIKDAGIAVLCVQAQDFAGISRAGPAATADTTNIVAQDAGLDGVGGEAAIEAQASYRDPCGPWFGQPASQRLTDLCGHHTS